MRQVTIYAIRDKRTLDVRYVGQTTSLRRRAHAGYHGALAEWLAGAEWEYVTLELVDLDQSHGAEQRHIDRLRALGCDLFNKNPATKNAARAVEPKSESGAKWTDQDYAHAGYGRLGLRLTKERLEALNELAAEDGCSRAELITKLIRNERRKRVAQDQH